MNFLTILFKIFELLRYLVGFIVGLALFGLGGSCAALLFRVPNNANSFVILVGIGEIIFGLIVCYATGRRIWGIARSFTDKPVDKPPDQEILS
jgi:hypothetical protein